MGWADMRIRQYNQGKKANWWEKRWLEHANPVNFAFHVLGMVLFIHGLWIHNLTFIILGLLLQKIGHWYCLFRGEKENNTVQLSGSNNSVNH